MRDGYQLGSRRAVLEEDTASVKAGRQERSQWASVGPAMPSKILYVHTPQLLGARPVLGSGADDESCENGCNSNK